MEEGAVDFVAKEEEVVGAGGFDGLVEGGFGDYGAGGVVGVAGGWLAISIFLWNRTGILSGGNYPSLIWKQRLKPRMEKPHWRPCCFKKVTLRIWRMKVLIKTQDRDWELILLYDNHLGVRSYQTFQLLDVQLPFVVFTSSPQAHLSPEAGRNLIKLLIRRIMTDYMVSFSDEAVEYGKIRGNGPRGNQDMLWMQWRRGL